MDKMRFITGRNFGSVWVVVVFILAGISCSNRSEYSNNKFGEPNFDEHPGSRNLLLGWDTLGEENFLVQFFENGSCSIGTELLEPEKSTAFSPCKFELMNDDLVKIIREEGESLIFRYSFSEDVQKMYLMEQFGDEQIFGFIRYLKY
ncbi:MAG: hypothetical protein N2C13_00035 [Chloroflexota bacterium]